MFKSLLSNLHVSQPIFIDDSEDLACLMTRDIHVAPDNIRDALLDTKIHGESSLSTHVFVPDRWGFT